jgi:hypothetical protein
MADEKYSFAVGPRSFSDQVSRSMNFVHGNPAYLEAELFELRFQNVGNVADAY